jgi:hypothetical protein
MYGAALNPVTSVFDYRAQPVLAATASRVSTDLLAAQAAKPAASIPAADNHPRKTEEAASDTSRDAIFDPLTNVVIFRLLDARTGAVIEQVPAQALVRRRAYMDALAVQALLAGKNPVSAAFAAVLA